MCVCVCLCVMDLCVLTCIFCRGACECACVDAIVVVFTCPRCSRIGLCAGGFLVVLLMQCVSRRSGMVYLCSRARHSPARDTRMITACNTERKKLVASAATR